MKDGERSVRVEAQGFYGELPSLRGRSRDHGTDRLRLLAEVSDFEGLSLKLEAKVAEGKHANEERARRWITDNPFAERTALASLVVPEAS